MIIFDKSQQPLIVITWPARWTPSQFDDSLGRLKALVREGKKIAILDDLLSMETAPSAAERRRVASVLEENLVYFKANVVGWADVVRSPLIRGTLTALFWFIKPQYPHRVFTAFDEAKVWCREMLAANQAELIAGTALSSVPPRNSILKS